MQISVCDGVIEIIDGVSSCSGVVSALEAQSIVYLFPSGFDVELFAMVNGAMLLSFVTGHFCGRVVRWLGR